MKIAIAYDLAYPHTIGGGERFLHCLARELVKRGHEVDYLTMRHWEGDCERFHEGVRYVGLGPRSTYAVTGKRNLISVFAYTFHLARHFRHYRYDAVQLCNFPYLPPLIAAWSLRGRPYCIVWLEFTGDYWERYLAKPLSSFARAYELFLMRASSKHLAISEFTAERMRASGHPDEVEVISGGVDLPDKVREASKPLSRSGILYVGRFQNHKRVSLVLQAAACLRRENVELPVILYGTGPEEAALRKQSVDLSISDMLTIRSGATDEEIADAMRKSRMLVLPSEREGLGLVVLEANAWGTPAVVCESPFSAAPRLIEPDLNGIISAPTPESLATAFRRVLSRPQEAWEKACVDMAGRYLYKDWAVRLETYLHKLKSEF